jgi:hypothetical protein
MGEDYIAEDGDCIGSVAFEHGFFWETLWDHPKNASLKELRKNPNVLMVGDTVHIPDLRSKEEDGATEQKHQFRLKGVPAKFHLRLMQNDKPRADVEYSLEVEGKTFSGKTDGNGEITQTIPPDARKGRLRVKSGNKWEEYMLRLGQLDPADKITGAQARIRNLGFDVGDEDGENGPLTEAGLRWFQKRAGLKVTGHLDRKTSDALEKEHDASQASQSKPPKEEAAKGKQWAAPDFTNTHQSTDMLDSIEEHEPATAPDWEDEPDEDDEAA